MSDVREEIARAVKATYPWTGKACDDIADVILARWDLTEKPVISDEELGRMVQRCYPSPTYTRDWSGQTFRELLADKGLRIVKVDE